MRLVLALIFCLLSGCAIRREPEPPPAKTFMVIEIHATPEQVITFAHLFHEGFRRVTFRELVGATTRETK